MKRDQWVCDADKQHFEVPLSFLKNPLHYFSPVAHMRGASVHLHVHWGSHYSISFVSGGKLKFEDNCLFQGCQMPLLVASLVYIFNLSK